MLTEAEMAAEIIATGADLEADWFPASLARFEVNPALWRIYGLVHPVRGFLDGRRFTPERDGRKLWACPVRTAGDPDAEDWRDVIRFAPMIDVVAFDPQRPAEIGLRCDMADFLGCAPPQDWLPDPVRVHRQPLGWLRACGHGLCLLTRDDRAAQSILVSIRRIAADDVAHGRELRRIAGLPLPGPEILVAVERSPEVLA